MPHQSLYRKYRPQTFSDVVGQEHIVRTLRNAVSEGAISHAYLFTGPRGTGKTTVARLLAKSLNCEKGPTPDPDVDCDACKEIAQGRHPDVHELDAASRTGVDDVREEIITKVQFAPTRGGWKVYIIDEVHMLSTSAFNALLKTLEEPPERTVFVLCTTHPQKIPATIHSRCQRFDFHRISVEQMVERLREIADAESIQRDESALTLIARHAAGGLRDAISTLEQLAVYTGSNIGLEDVEGLLGEVDSRLLYAIADLVAERDIAGAFRFVAERADVGTDMTEFARGMTGHFRDLYVVASVEDAAGIVDVPDEDISRLRAQAVRFGTERLVRCLDLLAGLLDQIRWSSDPRLALEVTLARMAAPTGEMTLEALAERVAALERGVVAAPAATGAMTAPKEECAPSPGAAEEVEAAGPSEEAGTAEPAADEPVSEEGAVTEGVGETAARIPGRAEVKRAWPTIMALVKKNGTVPMAQLFDDVEVDSDETSVVVEFPSDQRVNMELAGRDDVKGVLVGALSEVFGREVPVRYQLGRGPVVPASHAAAPGGAAEQTQSESSDTISEVERMLIEDLDAEVVDSEG